ncbi:MAG: tetratricopeptide repeat protein [Planctomycetes bacterium]|nr:tetratricopeptide repeat protein [Planctomycetota bacterium]
MDAETYSNDDVAKYLNENFVNVRVNTDEDKAMVEKFAVRGIPDTRILDSQGTVLVKIVGHDPAFLEKVQAVGAVAAAERKVAEKPGDVAVMLEAVDIYLKLEKWESAGRLCLKALEADPEDKAQRRVEVLYKFGMTWLRVDNIEECEAAWKQAGMLDPDNKSGLIDDIQFSRAEKQTKDEDHMAAMESLKRFIERYPDSDRIPDAKFLLGTSQFFSEETEEAVKTWKELIEAHAGTPAAKRAEKSVKFAEKKAKKKP